MSVALNRFDWLARYYDFLTRLVFGRAIYDSQVHFLTSVPRGSAMLVVGGGSGEFLPLLAEINPTCRVCFVEASFAMLTLADRNVSGELRKNITFIHGTEESIPEGMEFDVIITNFFLDLFTDRKVHAVCRKLHGKLHRDGLWIISDFVNGGKWWQKMMLRMMYRFFVVTCKIEASALPSWEAQVRVAGMKEKACKLFFGGFIKTAIYDKVEKT